MKKQMLLLLAALLLITAGCAKQNTEPDSSVPGYYGGEQSVQGGEADAKEQNLADVEVSRRQEDVVLTLSFARGATAGGETAVSEKLPAYTLTLLNNPSRLMVHVSVGMAEFLGKELEPMGEFVGLVTVSGEDYIDLYFEFEGQVAYKSSEEEGKLVLSVRADDPVTGEAYYVKMPFRDANAALATENTMAPALCEDGVNSYYLSQGVATLQEADALCQTLNTSLESAGSDDTAEVILLSAGALPAYSEPVTRSLLSLMGALKTPEGVLDGRLVAMDARFLCWTPDNDMLMARPQEETTGDGTKETYEEIWVYGLDGQRTQQMDTAFSSIQKAAFSKDGRYLALLEQSDGARLLYLYDSAKDGLTFLTAEGLGDYTADFAWGDNNILYAMSGDDSMQLMAYDPTLAARGEDALTVVEEREGGYGNVGFADGKVYFNDEYGNIYRVSTTDGQRELFDVGDGFKLSPDGKKMLRIVYEDGENAALASLYLCDLDDGTQLQIGADVTLSDFVWSGDSEILLYLTSNKDAQDASDYPVKLMRYTVSSGVTEELGVLASNSIFQGESKDSVILMFYQDRGGVFYPITYRLDLSSVTNHENDELIVTIEGDQP